MIWHSEMKNLTLPSRINSKIKLNHQPTSSELYKYYNSFVCEHEIQVIENHEVIDVVDNSKSKKLAIKSASNEDNLIIETRYLILSTGIFENKRRLKFKNLPEYCTYSSKINYKNKNLALVGGGNSAADFIINNLKNNKINWIIKKNNWDSIFFNIDHLFKKEVGSHIKNLKTYFNSEIIEFQNNRSIELSNNKVLKDIDVCTILTGFKPFSSILESWGLGFENECLVLNDHNETNIKKIYAFGSIASKWDKNQDKIEQTFVNNGNSSVLNKIIDSILFYESKEIFDFKRESFRDLYPEKTLLKKIVDKIFNK